MSHSILDRLTAELPNLAAKLEVAAKYALDNPDRMAFTSMRGVATECGVSPPTMLRLARHLGFDSYEGFKARFQSDIAGNSFAARAEALIGGDVGKRSPLIRRLREAALDNVADAMTQNPSEKFKTMASILRTADTTHLVAAGSMHWIAGHMENTGGIAFRGLRTARPGTATVIETLSMVGPKDAVLIIAVSPYARMAIDAVTYAREAGAQTMAITDRRSSPFAALVDHCLYASTASPHYYPSVVGIAALAETLLACAVADSRGGALSRIEAVEKLRLQSGAYLE